MTPNSPLQEPKPRSRSVGAGLAAFVGGLLVFIGLVMLGNSLGYFYISTGRAARVVSGIFLVGMGAWLVIRRQRDQMRRTTEPEPVISPPPGQAPNPSPASISPEPPGITNISAIVPPQGTSASASPPRLGVSGQFNAFSRPAPAQKLRYSKFIGNQDISIVGELIEDVEVSCFIGETLLDLRRARLSPGLNRVIVSGFLGEVRVLVPSTIPLFVRCSNFAGEITALGKKTGGLGNNLDAQNMTYTQSGTRLYVAVNNFAGEINVLTEA